MGTGRLVPSACCIHDLPVLLLSTLTGPPQLSSATDSFSFPWTGPNLDHATFIQNTDSIVPSTVRQIIITTFDVRLAPRSFRLKLGYSGFGVGGALLLGRSGVPWELLLA